MTNKCERLHVLCNRKDKIGFQSDGERVPEYRAIPLNGIYIMFEKGETGHYSDQIVRVGTHRGDGNLPSRLREHFIEENKHRIIFRKNIGRTLMKQDEKLLWDKWNLRI